MVERRGPRGPCGLKSYLPYKVRRGFLSRPARALWIEIGSPRMPCYPPVVEAREGLVD